jgi:hypothetical protein
MQRPREHYRRVEQKLRRLLERPSAPAGTAERVAGTSEETAELFSSGTAPAVRVTRDGPPPFDAGRPW